MCISVDERCPAADRTADRRERAHDVRREHGDAEEEKQNARPDREQAIGRAEIVGEHRTGQDDERGHDPEHRDPRHEGREPGLRKRRALAHRRDRRHARRPDGGEQAGDERDANADDERHDHRAQREDAVRGGQLDPEGAEEPLDPFGQERHRDPRPTSDASKPMASDSRITEPRI